MKQKELIKKLKSIGFAEEKIRKRYQGIKKSTKDWQERS